MADFGQARDLEHGKSLQLPCAQVDPPIQPAPMVRDFLFIYQKPGGPGDTEYAGPNSLGTSSCRFVTGSLNSGQVMIIDVVRLE